MGDRFGSPQVFSAPGWNISNIEENKFKTTSDGNLLVGVFGDVPIIGNIIGWFGMDSTSSLPNPF